MVAKSIEPIFQETFEKTYGWLQELCDIGSFRDHAQAYTVLRAVLHALRDRLVPSEAIDLAAEMPLLIKGIYFDGYSMSGKPDVTRSWDNFLETVRDNVRIQPNWDVQNAVTSVFELLSRHISAGEIEDVRNMLPREVADMFPWGRRV